MRSAKTNLLLFVALAILLSWALWGTRTSAANVVPIAYHGGAVMANSADVYVIWYGNWSGQTGPNSAETQDILERFLENFGGTPRYGTNSSYPDSAGAFPTSIIFGGEFNASFTHGSELTQSDIQQIVTEGFTNNHLPVDPAGIYLVIASSDVGSTATGFCSPGAAPHHGNFLFGTQQVKYAFIGNAARCPNIAAPWFFGPGGNQLPTPNANLAADGMVAMMAHALDTTATDPLRTGWFGANGRENADLCAGTFGRTFTTPSGARANQHLGQRDFLIEQNWVNMGPGYCAMFTDPPPVADNQTVQMNQDTTRPITLTASDPNGDPLSFIVVTPPQHGTLSPAGNNGPAIRTYTPAVNFHGADSFTFKANDGYLDSNIATITITVNKDWALDGFDPNANGMVRTAVVQPDGKILIGGDFTSLTPNGSAVSVARNYVARVNTDGTVDSTFDPNANSSVQAIALQPDGKILLAGDFNSLAPNGGPSIVRGFIARLNPDGTADPTFDQRANGSVFAVAVQPDGGILIGGDFTVLAPGGGAPITRKRIARVNSDGTLDSTFDPGANVTVNALAVQFDGRILMGGGFTTLTPNGGAAVTRNYLARLNLDGTLDGAFNPNPDKALGGIALQPDGKILIGGSFDTLTPNGGALITRSHMARLNTDGTVDAGFNPSPNSFVRVIVLQADGRILIGGSFTALAPNGGGQIIHKYIARLNPDGTMETGLDPAPNDQVFTIAVQPDNKIILGGPFYSANSIRGQTRNRIARLETDGRLDQSLNLNAVGSSVRATAVQADGKILIGGDFTSVQGVARNNLARLNPDGTVDTNFNPNVNGSVNFAALQPDSKIVIGGFFSALTPNGGPSVTRNNVARLNPDGTVDSTFDPNPNNLVTSIAIQTDGKILLGGFFTSLAPNGGASVQRGFLVRLNSNGTLDTAFNPGPDKDINTIVLQADGKILLGGAFTFFAANGGTGIGRVFLARLNTDGTLDTTFDAGAHDKVYAIAVQPDGKIVVGGAFFWFGPDFTERFRIARLNANGSLDDSFNPKANNFVNSLALQADGKILMGGAFNGLAPNDGPPVTRNYVARLNPDGSVDDGFAPDPNDVVNSIAMQADGKVLLGGSFASVGGEARNLFARLANDTPAIQKLTITPATISWQRSSAAPQLSQVTFERSSDGINYTFLGNGTRIGSTSDFALVGQSLPLQQTVYIRARGFYRSGGQTASQSITESVRNIFLWPPMHLSFGQQPSSTVAGNAISPAVTVQILDTADTPVNTTAAVTVALGSNPSGGTLSGTKTVAAVGGLATFNDLSVDKAGAYTLMASGPAFRSTISNQFFITASAASAITPTAGSGQSATINSNFATTLQATVKDASGNPVSGVNVTFTAPASGASGIFANNTTTTNALTNASGIATAATFTANGTAGQYSVMASINSGSLTTSFGLTNNKGSQAISITTHAPTGATYHTQFSVAANTSSGLPVSYSSSGSCSNNGATFTINSGTGTCTVKYDQAGDANHHAASQVTETVTAQKAAQTITLEAIANKTFGDADFALSASSSSNLALSFATSGQCTVNGSSVHITGANSCTITASQGGDSNYNAAADVQRSFQIAKASQTITLDAVADKTFGNADFAANATSSSGLAVSFAAAGQCSSARSNIHLAGAGSCTITASQAGDSNYNAAPDAQRSFQIAKAVTQTQLSSANDSSNGMSFTAAVTSAAGVPNGTVTFKDGGVTIGSCVDVTLNSGNASCSTALSAGSHTITADYSGEANFNASTASFTVEQTSAGGFQFSQATYLVAERGGSIIITVKRAGDVRAAASVDYVTDDGSDPAVAVPCSLATGRALERCDYTRAAGTLRFAANETEKSFVVLVNDDSYVEGPETISLKLMNPAGAPLDLQATATLEITDDVTESAGNPVDGEAMFVRQHYHDFLNREPDPDGLDFWTNNLAACDTDGCVERKRVDTSAAFFLSIEFQETGYLVERLYKVAYGDMTGTSTFDGPHQLSVPVVRLREFLLDTQEIGQGVIVGQGPWRDQLEEHKQAFAQEFVSRQRFAEAYPAGLTAAEFVGRLNLNAGGVLNETETSQLADIFGGSQASSADTAKRAQALRWLADNQTLQQREFNRAFVLMQYFAYLRRNPNDAQDTDYTGYDFWLRKLDRFGGNYINAEMVKAFVSSIEYRQRFAQ